MDLIRILVVLILLGIVASLATALYHLYHGADSQKMVRALGVRVALSLALFILLMVAWWAGLISPRGVGQ